MNSTCYTRKDLLDEIESLRDELEEAKEEYCSAKWEAEDLRNELNCYKKDLEIINEYCKDCDDKYNTIKCLGCKLNQFKSF